MRELNGIAADIASESPLDFHLDSIVRSSGMVAFKFGSEVSRKTKKKRRKKGYRVAFKLRSCCNGIAACDCIILA